MIIFDESLSLMNTITNNLHNVITAYQINSKLIFMDSLIDLNQIEFYK